MVTQAPATVACPTVGRVHGEPLIASMRFHLSGKWRHQFLSIHRQCIDVLVGDDGMQLLVRDQGFVIFGPVRQGKEQIPQSERELLLKEADQVSGYGGIHVEGRP